MSKEAALNFANQNNPQVPEPRVSPVSGVIPENYQEAANPAVSNAGVVPESALSHLAKKEAKFLSDRQAFKKEQEEFRETKARAQEFYDKAKAFEETRKIDPIKALKEIGFSEKEIIDYLSQEEEPKLSTEEIVQLELKKFKEEEAKKLSEIQAQKDAQTISEFKKSLKDIVLKDPEAFEFSAYQGEVAEDLMYEIAVIEAQEGREVDARSIAEEVEEFYMNQYQAMSKFKKNTLKPMPAEPTPVPQRSRVVHPPQDMGKATEAPKATRTTTLTNRMVPTVGAIARGQERMESRSEKRTRLEALIREHGLRK